MSNEWELVIKGGKHKAKAQLTNKELKRITQNNLSNNKYRLALDEETDKSLSPEQEKVSTKAKNKKPNVSKFDDINKQINQISGDSIKKIYANLSEKFPNQQTVSLLDLGVHLSMMVKTNEEMLKNINFDQTDFPYALLTNDAKNALKTIFNNLSNSHVCNFLKSAMLQLLDDYDKGVHSIGLRMLINVCVRLKYSVFVTNRKNFFDLFNLYREQTIKFKILSWVIRQACSNYNMACQIWLIYLLPFITQKCHTEFVIGFGEEMRDYPVETGTNETGLLVTDFVPIIDLIFNQNIDGGQQNDRKSSKRKQGNFQLTANQIDRLKRIYVKIKEQAFLSKSPGALKDYFASLFLRLSQNKKSFNKELLDCLDHCVKVCPESIQQLHHLHVELNQTKIFLDHLSKENSSAFHQLKQSKSFRSIIDKIQSANLGAPVGSVQDNLHNLSKNFRSSKKNSGSWFSFFGRSLVYLFVLGFVLFGIMYHQYPQQYREIQKAIAPYYFRAVEQLRPIYEKIEASVLHVYELALPWLSDFAEKAKTKLIDWSIIAKPYVNRAGVKINEILMYCQSKLDEYLPTVLEGVTKAILAIGNYFVQLSNSIVEYFQSDDFQNLLTSIQQQTKIIKNQIMDGYRFIVNYTNEMFIGNH